MILNENKPWIQCIEQQSFDARIPESTRQKIIADQMTLLTRWPIYEQLAKYTALFYASAKLIEATQRAATGEVPVGYAAAGIGAIVLAKAFTTFKDYHIANACESIFSQHVPSMNALDAKVMQKD